ncbi:MAG: hypothetical protein LBR89_03335 [Holosporales bacterium]|jgi:glucose-6-phosphate isomerase|nr:hypothetical protein [Holosporales bacterium]
MDRNDYCIDISQDKISISDELLIPIFSGVKKLIDTLPLFNELDLDLIELLAHARRFRAFQDVIVFGTGGSCLSGKMYATFKDATGPKMHFVDNVDPYEWNRLMNAISPQTTGIVVISKSGNTTETLCQTFMALRQWENVPEHFLFVTDPGENALREIAEHDGITCLDHPIGIGGRFSGFSVVGLLPALIAGVDAKDVLHGASEVMCAFLQHGPFESNPVLASAYWQNDLFLKGINMSVLFCYAERLHPFAEWYRQLWSESLGKKDNYAPDCGENCKRYGTTPVVSLGTIDQHSQLQLYVDGPRDKFFTIVAVGDHPKTEPVSIGGVSNFISRALDGHTMAELFVTHQQVTQQTLVENGNPTRNIFIPEFNERSLGQLMMFSILETLALACIWRIDPFNQPGVKFGKDRVIALMR